MTDLDLVSLYHESVTLQNDILTSYIYVVFAFLVASYLVAHKLKVLMVMLVVILFTSISAFFLMELYFLNLDMTVLSSEMALRVANNEFSLPGLGMAGIADGLTIFDFSKQFSFIGSYFGALLFFFYQRSHKEETI